MTSDTLPGMKPVAPRARIICDNDFQGDPDGLIQLAHLLLSDAVETRGLIASHLGTYDAPESEVGGPDVEAIEAMGAMIDHSPAAAARAASDVMTLCGKNVPIFEGAAHGLKDANRPIDNEAARFIIAEARREDIELPLYVVCGAGLTAVASALMLAPDIADRFTLVWIGGGEYPGVDTPPGAPICEYNLNTDLKAGQFVFGHSSVALWQIPRDVYRQTIVSKYELLLRMRNRGALGRHLYDQLYKLIDFLGNVGVNAGESYVMGDSPLVLVTALQTTFEPDSGSSFHQVRACPTINDDGSYSFAKPGRDIRVYTQVDNRLMFEDFFSKLEWFNLTATGVS